MQLSQISRNRQLLIVSGIKKINILYVHNIKNERSVSTLSLSIEGGNNFFPPKKSNFLSQSHHVIQVRGILFACQTSTQVNP